MLSRAWPHLNVSVSAVEWEQLPAVELRVAWMAR